MRIDCKYTLQVDGGQTERQTAELGIVGSELSLIGCERGLSVLCKMGANSVGANSVRRETSCYQEKKQTSNRAQHFYFIVHKLINAHT